MDNQIMVLGLTERNGKVVVSSRDIARVFEKEHKNVLKDIRELRVSAEFSRLNFEQSTFVSDRGKEYPEYLLTRDGFTILAMGYVGEKAMRFKEAYISAFNEMERRLQSLPSITDLVNNPQLLLQLVTKHIETRQENERLQITVAKYEGQTNTVGLYKAGEIAKELGVSAMKLNKFLQHCRVQYKPNGSNTWQLYTDYAKDHIAMTQIVSLDNGYEMPMLLWTAKGRNFIFDLAEREMPSWYA